MKIDVLTTSFEEQKRIVSMCHQLGISAIAEKVETDQQFQICKSLGYAFFQGYFFCRPQMVTRRSVAANKIVYLELLRAANENEFDLLKIAGISKRHVSLSYRLLRFLNSPLFGCMLKFVLSLTRFRCWGRRPCANGSPWSALRRWAMKLQMGC